MNTCVGLDWGGNGWVAVVATGPPVDRQFEVTVYPSILNAWRDNHDAESILVDIPIGLATDTRRVCDKRAKSILGADRSRVFYTPVRDAVYEDEYETAGNKNEAATGNRISTQAYHICPRIREVDCLLRTHEQARAVIRESHPELCFVGLAGESVPEGKTTDGGRARRRSILADAIDRDREEVESIERREIDDQPQYARRLGASNRDDLLDAFALAVTAGGETVSLPADRPTDRYGLPMEIVVPAGIRSIE